MWIARDKNNWLFIYDSEPIKKEDGWESDGSFYALPEELFPEVKWEDSKAKKLEII